MDDTIKKPKVFISYSWTSHNHQQLVIEWADRLASDGVDIVLDVYDLKEGDDKYVFMEKMVTDKSVTHVLAFCDKTYMEKADSRREGVGTESQIISKEVYDKVSQSKFIPIVCDINEDGNPFLPTFFKNRIWINFSSPELVNNNWERLIRLLHGKPLYIKPKTGNPPTYITENSQIPTSPIVFKFNNLKIALLQGKPGISLYRRDFLDTCLEYIDQLRVREKPEIDKIGEMILEKYDKLKISRNHIIDWLQLESEITDEKILSNIILTFLENLRLTKLRAPELNTWDNSWLEAHSVFVYETFLYCIALLIKFKKYNILHDIFRNYYMTTEEEQYNDFANFDKFYGASESLQILAPAGKRLYSPSAELIKINSDRSEITFLNIIEADLLILLMAMVIPHTKWFPQTLYYSSYGTNFPLFKRATCNKYFQELTIITGISDADQLRKYFKEGYQKLRIDTWNMNLDFGLLMNIDKMDSIK